MESGQNLNKLKSTNNHELKELIDKSCDNTQDVQGSVLVVSENIEISKEDVPEVKFIAPDGGWAWVVLGAAIYITIMITSAGMCFSIEFGPLMKKMQMSTTAIAWVFNIRTFVWNIITPMAGPLSKKLGYRKIALITTFISAVCYMVLAVATSPAYFYIFYSILYGTFAGICFNLNTIILGAYFDKHRGLALCLHSAAVPTGYAIMPQVVIALQNQYGFIGATLMHGGLLLNACVAAALYHPVERHQRKIKATNTDNCCEESTETKTVPTSRCMEEVNEHHSEVQKRKKIILNRNMEKKEKTGVYEGGKEVLSEVVNHWKNCFRFFKSYRLLINGYSYGFFIVGYINFGMLAPFAMVTEGYSYEDAAKFLSCAATANLVVRLTISILADRKWFNNKLAYISGSAIASVFCALFVLALSDLRYLLLCSIGWGAGIGMTASLWVVLLIETMGIHDYVRAMGTTGIILAALYITIGPLLGLLRDISSSYAWSLYSCALLQFSAAALWTLMPLAVTRDANKQAKSDGKC